MSSSQREFKGDQFPKPLSTIQKLEQTPEWKAIQKFSNFTPPEPINKEVQWDKSKIIVSKTDPYGVIEYANDVFIAVSGYAEFELMGMPHNIIRHPDMPKVLFKVLWDNLKQGNVVHPVVKNLAKSGRYYWVIADFEIKKNDKGEIINYYSRRRSVAQEVVDKVEVLYEKLLQIEHTSGVGASEKYLMGYLEDIGKSYNQFIEDLVLQYTPEPPAPKVATSAPKVALSTPMQPEEDHKRGFFARFFGKK